MGINLFKFAVHWPVRLIQLMDLNAKIPVNIQINVVQNSISATAMRRLWPDASWDLEPRLVCVSRSVCLSSPKNLKQQAESGVTQQSLTPPRNKTRNKLEFFNSLIKPEVLLSANL